MKASAFNQEKGKGLRSDPLHDLNFAKVRVQLYCRDTAAAPCKYTISHHTHHHLSSPPAPPLLHTQSQTDEEYSVIRNVFCVFAVQVGVIIIVTVHK